MKGACRKKVTAFVALLATLLTLFPAAAAKPEEAKAAMEEAGTVFIEGVGNLRILFERDDGYVIALDEHENLVITGTYHHNPDAEISYHTKYLYLTKEDTGGNPTSGGQKTYIDFEIDKHHETRVGTNSIRDTYKVNVIELKEKVKNLFNDKTFEGPYTVYLSEGFVIKRRPGGKGDWKPDSGPVYNTLDGIRGAQNIRWSTSTWNGFENYFDAKIVLDLDPIPTPIPTNKPVPKKYKVIIDTNPADGSGGIAGGGGEFYPGETVSPWASANTGWMFVDWSGGLVDLGIKDVTAENISFTMPNHDVYLTANFEKSEYDVTPLVRNKYRLTLKMNPKAGGSATGAGEYFADELVKVQLTVNEGWEFVGWTGGEDLEIGKTAKKFGFFMPARDVTLTATFKKKGEPAVSLPPTPTPGPTATPKPTATPRPTATPTPLPESNDSYYMNHRYYTTDKGYSIETLYDSMVYASQSGVDNGAKAWLFSDNREYSVGTDDFGNEWYFIDRSPEATYVHPKTYEGFDVRTEAHKITELVFPGKIKKDGTEYKVTSIGGSMAKFTDNSFYSGGKYVDELTTTYQRPTYGYYSYIKTLEDNYYRLRTESLSMEYRLGVLGNGVVSSIGGPSNTMYSGDNISIQNTWYASSYTVYNTTLKEITIPGTVTRIEDCAFMGCNALVKIHDAYNVREIGRYAFAGGSVEAQLSVLHANGGYTYYHFNESYATRKPFTPVMEEYDKTRVLSKYLPLPAFALLKKIQENGFDGRKNLIDVVLPAGLQTIEKNAFANCYLNSIEVPGMTTVIEGGEQTLGTKGYIKKPLRTIIYTEPESKAMIYGLEFIRYYSLRCGYDVTYDNNFEPEETYVTRAEMKEEWVEVVKKRLGLPRHGTFSLDTEGRLWFGDSEKRSYINNILPQLVDFGSKVVDIENAYMTGPGDQKSTEYGSGVQPAGRLFAYTEDGKVYAYDKTLSTPEDIKTPYKSVWRDVGVPEGSSSFQWTVVTTGKSTGGTYSSGSGTNSYYNPMKYRSGWLFYLDANGEIYYTIQGSSYQNISTNSQGYYTGDDHPTFIEYVSPHYKVKMPQGVTFKKISVQPAIDCGGTGTDYSSSSGTNYSSFTEKFTANVYMPPIYAVDTEGNAWVGYAKKNVEVEYTSEGGVDYNGRPYSNITGTKVFESGSSSKVRPEIEARGTITANDYVWERYDIVDLFPIDTTLDGEYRMSNVYGVTTEGGLVLIKGTYGAPNDWLSDVETRPVRTEIRTGVDAGVKFVGSYSISGAYNSHSTESEKTYFLIDEEGYTWINGSDLRYTDSTGEKAYFNYPPVKFMRDATFRNVYVLIGVAKGDTYASGDVYYRDTKDRIWRFARTTDGKGAELLFDPPSRIKKLETHVSNMYWTEYNYYGSEINTQLIVLLQNGEIYAIGTDAESIYGHSNNGDYVGFAGGSSDREFRKVSGNVLFDDMNAFIYGGGFNSSQLYTLAITDKFEVYRTGYSVDRYGNLTSDKEYYTFLPTDTPWVEEDNYLFTGYYFAADLYDCMFPRDNYVFLHWNREENNSGTFLYPGEELVVDSPVRLYAQWEKECNKVRYHPNGASGFMEDTVTDPPAGNKVTLRKNTYYLGGYVFNGWNTKADGTGTSYADEAEFVMKKGTTVLFAMWKKADKYTLKVAKDEECVRPVEISSTHRLDYDEYFTMPDALADRTHLVDYKLNKQSYMSTTPRWITATPFTEEYTTSRQEFMCWTLYEEEKKDTTYNFLYRMFYPKTRANQLTQHMEYASVLFPLWSGPEAYVLFPEIACDGYWQTGWAESATGKVGFIDAPEGSGAMFKPTKPNTTLYAYYEPKQYDVELVVEVEDAEPGEIRQDQTSVRMTFDAVLPDVIPPESEVYTFMGYYDKLDESGIPTEDAVMYYDEAGAPALDEAGNPMVWRIHDGSVTKLYAYMLSEVEVELDGRGATKQEQTSVLMTYDQVGPDVIPPEKTGYTFQGYFTKIRGEGKQYFDAEGHGSAVWREKKVRVLYAYWIQNEVKLPEKEKEKISTPTPEDRVFIDAKLTDGMLQLYADDNDPSTGAETDQQPYLVADVRNGEKLVAAGAIPSTENVALRAKLGAWLLRCSLTKKGGVDRVRVHVTVPYRTQYEKAEDESLIISKRQTKTIDVMVPKEWSYWILEEGGIYFPEKVVVKNDSITGGTVEVPVTWNTENAVKKPDYTITSYGEKDAHVSFVSYDADGTPSISVTAEEQYIVSKVPGKLPEVDTHLSVIAHNTAWGDTTQFTVKSDRLSVAGVTLLSDEKTNTGHGRTPQKEAIEAITGKIAKTAYTQTYKSGIPLLSTVPNGRYDTEAYAVYKAEAVVREGKQDSAGEGCSQIAGKSNKLGEQASEVSIREIPLLQVNEINIHTPVVCAPKISADHENMYQCIEIPEGSTVLVLDEADRYSDFVLSVGNTGYHSDKKGYRERNYTEFLMQKNGTVQNEVRFPFALWIDTGNDGNKENDALLSEGQWYTLGTEEQRFYVPVWTKEGSYEFEFRSVAINGAGMETTTEWECNCRKENYVAVKTIKVYVTGRLYDFTVHEVKGTTVWNTATEKGLCYTVGTKPPEYSLWNTLPLRKGVHPQYRNLGGLPRGGTIAFSVKSAGISCGEGAMVQAEPHLFVVENGTCREVDVYYEAETENGPILKVWNPREQSISLLGKDTKKGVRQWNGTFTLPEKLYITETGTDVWAYRKQHGLSFTEDFWLTDVSLMLRFGLQLESVKGELLYYGMIPEEIANNIWQTEAEVLYREDNDTDTFQVLGGETAVVYPGDSIALGQMSHGIY